MGSRYPEVGDKLNIPAIITFFNVKRQGNLKIHEFCDRLREIAQQRDSQHISYNEKSFEWTLRVEHF
jgi:hypothetical protein